MCARERERESTKHSEPTVDGGKLNDDRGSAGDRVRNGKKRSVGEDNDVGGCLPTGVVASGSTGCPEPYLYGTESQKL